MVNLLIISGILVSSIGYSLGTECPEGVVRRVGSKSSCDRYYECAGGRVFPQECKSGFCFSAKHAKCRPCPEVSCPQLQCPKPTGRYPIEGKCNLYVSCSKNTAHIFACVPGSMFHPGFKSCVPATFFSKEHACSPENQFKTTCSKIEDIEERDIALERQSEALDRGDDNNSEDADAHLHNFYHLGLVPIQTLASPAEMRKYVQHKWMLSTPEQVGQNWHIPVELTYESSDQDDGTRQQGRPGMIPSRRPYWPNSGYAMPMRRPNRPGGTPGHGTSMGRPGRPGGTTDYGRPMGRPDYSRPMVRPDFGRPMGPPDYGRPTERPDYGRPEMPGGRPIGRPGGAPGRPEISMNTTEVPQPETTKVATTQSATETTAPPVGITTTTGDKGPITPRPRPTQPEDSEPEKLTNIFTSEEEREANEDAESTVQPSTRNQSSTTTTDSPQKDEQEQNTEDTTTSTTTEESRSPRPSSTTITTTTTEREMTGSTTVPTTGSTKDGETEESTERTTDVTSTTSISTSPTSTTTSSEEEITEPSEAPTSRRTTKKPKSKPTTTPTEEDTEQPTERTTTRMPTTRSTSSTKDTTTPFEEETTESTKASKSRAPTRKPRPRPTTPPTEEETERPTERTTSRRPTTRSPPSTSTSTTPFEEETTDATEASASRAPTKKPRPRPTTTPAAEKTEEPTEGPTTKKSTTTRRSQPKTTTKPFNQDSTDSTEETTLEPSSQATTTRATPRPTTTQGAEAEEDQDNLTTQSTKRNTKRPTTTTQEPDTETVGEDLSTGRRPDTNRPRPQPSETEDDYRPTFTIRLKPSGGLPDVEVMEPESSMGQLPTGAEAPGPYMGGAFATASAFASASAGFGPFPEPSFPETPTGPVRPTPPMRFHTAIVEEPQRIDIVIERPKPVLRPVSVTKTRVVTQTKTVVITSTKHKGVIDKTPVIGTVTITRKKPTFNTIFIEKPSTVMVTLTQTKPVFQTITVSRTITVDQTVPVPGMMPFDVEIEEGPASVETRPTAEGIPSSSPGATESTPGTANASASASASAQASAGGPISPGSPEALPQSDEGPTAPRPRRPSGRRPSRPNGATSGVASASASASAATSASANGAQRCNPDASEDETRLSGIDASSDCEYERTNIADSDKKIFKEGISNDVTTVILGKRIAGLDREIGSNLIKKAWYAQPDFRPYLFQRKKRELAYDYVVDEPESCPGCVTTDDKEEYSYDDYEDREKRDTTEDDDFINYDLQIDNPVPKVSSRKKNLYEPGNDTTLNHHKYHRGPKNETGSGWYKGHYVGIGRPKYPVHASVRSIFNYGPSKKVLSLSKRSFKSTNSYDEELLSLLLPQGFFSRPYKAAIEKNKKDDLKIYLDIETDDGRTLHDVLSEPIKIRGFAKSEEEDLTREVDTNPSLRAKLILDRQHLKRALANGESIVHMMARLYNEDGTRIEQNAPIDVKLDSKKVFNYLNENPIQKTLRDGYFIGKTDDEGQLQQLRFTDPNLELLISPQDISANLRESITKTISDMPGPFEIPAAIISDSFELKLENANVIIPDSPFTPIKVSTEERGGGIQDVTIPLETLARISEQVDIMKGVDRQSTPEKSPLPESNAPGYDHCRYYLVCVGGRPIIKMCPEGLVYCPVRRKCISPQLAAKGACHKMKID